MAAVRLVLGLLALAVVVAVSVATRGSDVWLLALLLGGQVVARAIVMNAAPWLQVDHRLHRAAFLEVGTAAIGTFGLALGIWLEWPTPLLGLVAATAPMALLAVLLRSELAKTPSAVRRFAGANAHVVKSVLREAAPLAGAIALAAIYTRSSVAFVNAYETDERASQFFFAFFFAEQCIVAAGIVAGALLPLMAHRARVADLRTDRVSHDILLATASLGAVTCAVLLAAAPILTRVLGGEALAGSEDFIWQLAPTAPIVFMSMPLAYMLISMGLGYRYIAFAAIGLVANLSLNFLFTPEHGASASTRITWLTELSVSLIPLVTLLVASRAGLRTLILLTTLVGACVSASELIEAGTLPSTGTAILVAITALLCGTRSMARLRRLTALT